MRTPVKNFIQSAVKHPGRIKNLAKREGISTKSAASKAAHSANKSLAAAGRLAIRFQSGDLKHGGSTVLKAGSMKSEAAKGRAENVKRKMNFRGC
jgi:hypothetical protein